MEILQHFDRENKPNFILYRLKDGDWAAFIEKLTIDFRICYIDDEALKDLASKANITESEFLERYVLPDNPIIKSGDFGELLSFNSVKENLEAKGLVLTLPIKWRWKESRNKPSPCADGIILHIKNEKKFTVDDLLVSIESKMKATKSNANRIQEAIDGAAKDKLSRLSKTLNWMEERYAKDGNEVYRKIVERFKDPAAYGDFSKTHKAVVILDKGFEVDDLAKPIKNDNGICVIVFSIKELQKGYETTRTNIINSI